MLKKRFKNQYDFQYVGYQLNPKQLVAQKIQLRKDNLLSLNDFQKLLKEVNLLRVHLKLTKGELKFMFDIFVGDINPNYPGKLIDKGRIIF